MGVEPPLLKILLILGAHPYDLVSNIFSIAMINYAPLHGS